MRAVGFPSYSQYNRIQKNSQGLIQILSQEELCSAPHRQLLLSAPDISLFFIYFGGLYIVKFCEDQPFYTNSFLAKFCEISTEDFWFIQEKPFQHGITSVDHCFFSKCPSVFWEVLWTIPALFSTLEVLLTLTLLSESSPRSTSLG